MKCINSYSIGTPSCLHLHESCMWLSSLPSLPQEQIPFTILGSIFDGLATALISTIVQSGRNLRQRFGEFIQTG